MKKTLTFLLFCTFQIIFSQNVFKSQKHIYLAEYYAHQKDDNNALKHYLEAIKINPKNPSSYIYLEAAAIAFKLKDNKIAKELMAQSITKQLAPFEFLSDYKNLQPFKDSKEMKEVLSDYDSLEKQYYRELKNPAMYMEIQSLIATDQLIRQENEIFVKLTNKIDSTNILRLIDLTKKYGWEDRAWLLLWHHRGYSIENKFVWDFFKTFIKKEIEKDNVQKDFFVDFDEFDNAIKNFDNHSDNGAIYTLNSIGNINGSNHFIDIQNLDKRRKSVGLPPLYFEYFLSGVDLIPKDYHYNPKNLLSDLENL